ncbi:MAG: 2-C-methyl-D-erythritol 4-phosphate cytidylyltransferase [Candidatus Eisenbacteria bacterium]
MFEPAKPTRDPAVSMTADPGGHRQRCWCLLLGGGLGARLAGDRPKLFALLAGRPLAEWSLRTFASHPGITDLLIAVPRGWERPFREGVLAPFMDSAPECAAKMRGVIPGGERRQDSARLALKAASEIQASRPKGRPPLVLIHDAARPLVPAELITSLMETLGELSGEQLSGAPDEKAGAPETTGAGGAEAADGEAGAAGKKGRAAKSRRKGTVAEGPKPTAIIPVLPVGDTLKSLDRNARVAATVSRESLWQAQTPQAFVLDVLLGLHELAMEAGHAVTDDAMLYEWRGFPVRTVLGSPLNMKVTYPHDLALLEAWLLREQARSQSAEPAGSGAFDGRGGHA